MTTLRQVSDKYDRRADFLKMYLQSKDFRSHILLMIGINLPLNFIYALNMILEERTFEGIHILGFFCLWIISISMVAMPAFQFMTRGWKTFLVFNKDEGLIQIKPKNNNQENVSLKNITHVYLWPSTGGITIFYLTGTLRYNKVLAMTGYEPQDSRITDLLDSIRKHSPQAQIATMKNLFKKEPLRK